MPHNVSALQKSKNGTLMRATPRPRLQTNGLECARGRFVHPEADQDLDVGLVNSMIRSTSDCSNLAGVGNFSTAEVEPAQSATFADRPVSSDVRFKKRVLANVEVSPPKHSLGGKQEAGSSLDVQNSKAKNGKLQ
ncbi:hypothetical protein PSTG_10226 [Puccinia striiformis f. sp. tritici PST-78]|uniref:Uncharacterized protein n=1 Tax=Puccinia striiformis f. sp. tritici PST-78 TaxID=1165861 RepID=A0A0L0VB75_9BASI|nr:hypothetical protein PSTG_10226 [Puccinia striiformis f. sp. tritici PST-78]